MENDVKQHEQHDIYLMLNGNGMVMWLYCIMYYKK